MISIRALTVGTVAVGLCGLLAGVAPATAQQEAAPYPAVIDVPKVEVRSGAGRAFYPVGELKRGQPVTVVDEYWDWYRITAPEDVFMFVLRRDVDAKGDGTRGVVNTDLTRVYAAGLNRTAADSFKFTMNLRQGDEVRIVASDGDHYKIVPPQGALVFLPPGTIKPAEPGDAAPSPDPALVDAQTPTRDDMVPLDAEPTAPEVAATATDPPASDTAVLVTPPAVGAEVTPTLDAETPVAPEVVTVEAADPRAVTGEVVAEPAVPAVAADTTTESPDLTGLEPDTPEVALAVPEGDVEPVPFEFQPVETPAITPGLRDVELAELKKFQLPVEQQPLDQMQLAYEAFATQAAEDGTELPLADQRILEVRLAAIQRNRQLAAALAQIQQRQQGVAQIAPVREDVSADEPFAAVGVLRASSVFSGEGMPQMFRVIDPSTRRTIAYVRAAQGVDPSVSLGQLVGVKGQREFDPSLNTQLITAQQLTVLDPTGS